MNRAATKILKIADIGFLFEINSNIKYNLMSPDVLAFFDGVPESEEVTKDCAFPPSIPNTNIMHSIFLQVGHDWTECYDRVFRKCPIVKCNVKCEDLTCNVLFFIDSSLKCKDIMGVICNAIV